MANWSAGPPPYRPVPPYQQWPDRARRRVAPGVLFGVTVWRLVIVLFAIIGFSLAMQDAEGPDAMAALSQQASLLVAICYGFLLLFPVFTGGWRHEPDTPWLRGALTVLLSLVSITFLTMLGGDVSQTWSLFEHVLTPAVVLLDWLAVGRDQRNARWWFPISWLAFPVAYLLFYIAYVGNGPPLYPFLDPAASDFLGVVFDFLGGVLVFGFVVYGLGKLHGQGRR